MESRMDKYYKSDVSGISRSKKNQNLYDQIYHDYQNVDRFEVPDNVNVVDLNNLKKGIASRDDYKKIKEYEDIYNKRVKIGNESNEIIQKEEKTYDINELIKRAKKDNSNVNLNKNMYDYNFLQSLQDSDLIYENKIDEEVENDNALSRTKYQTKIINDEEGTVAKKIISTSSLPLDILSELKPTDNTIVSAPIVDEEMDAIEQKKEKRNNDATFYSGSYTFSKKDFIEEDDIIPKKEHYTFKIILLLIGICVCIIVIYFMFVGGSTL